jgi:hypothetical protein
VSNNQRKVINYKEDYSGLYQDRSLVDKEFVERVSSNVSKFIMGEHPVGLVNNLNTTFTTAFEFVPTMIEVFYNGVRQNIGINNDYTEADTTTIVFNFPPKKGIITVNYIKS